MVTPGRLRDLFDGAPTPHIAHPPHTHHRDFYLATDGSFAGGRGGLGVIVETGGGERVLRLARFAESRDNNVAEYRALRLGLDALAPHADPSASVGVLVDHDGLAANVNGASLGVAAPDWPASPVRVPAGGETYWRDIRAGIRRYADVRAAAIRSDENPAHVLANAPDEYAHLDEPSPVAGQDWAAPPPSRADRHAADD